MRSVKRGKKVVDFFPRRGSERAARKLYGSLSDTNLTVSRYEHARRYRVLVLHVVWYACRSLRSVRCVVRDRFRCACGKDADLRLQGWFIHGLALPAESEYGVYAEFAID